MNPRTIYLQFDRSSLCQFKLTEGFCCRLDYESNDSKTYLFETITEKWENAEIEVIKLKGKIQGMITSQITLDHIIATQRPHKSKTGLGYEAVAPPVNHNYSKLPLNPNVAPGSRDFIHFTHTFKTSYT